MDVDVDSEKRTGIGEAVAIRRVSSVGERGEAEGVIEEGGFRESLTGGVGPRASLKEDFGPKRGTGRGQGRVRVRVRDRLPSKAAGRGGPGTRIERAPLSSVGKRGGAVPLGPLLKQCATSRASFLAEISLYSPRNIVIFLIKKYIFIGSKYSKIY